MSCILYIIDRYEFIYLNTYFYSLPRFQLLACEFYQINDYMDESCKFYNKSILITTRYHWEGVAYIDFNILGGCQTKTHTMTM